MLFPTLEFFLFFTLVLILNWTLKRWPLAWRLFLLGASYFFYFTWNSRLLLILILVSLFNFLSARMIAEFSKRRKLILALSVIVNISVLGSFKYYDFFRVSTELLLRKIGLSINLPFLIVILSVGLSFYIFRAISYNVDVYLKKIPPTSSVIDLSLYIAFFPQLLAGPIMRAGNFLVQLKNGGARKIDDTYKYLALIILGLFKKVIISTYLTLHIVDYVFSFPEEYSSSMVLLAIFAYSLFIYLDFSSYTDLAIGFAGLMGFKSPINFDFPYLSLNIQEFWRKWHITLSNWVRDYIYIPLGGNRKGEIRKYFNLMAAMVLIGLWHGAANHFVLWGAIHGTALVVFHFYSDRLRVKSSKKITSIKKVFCWFVTFNFVSFAWIFFALTTNDSLRLIRSLFNFRTGINIFSPFLVLLVLIGFLIIFFEKRIIRELTSLQQKMRPLILALFMALIIIFIFKLSPESIPSFLYFNF